MKRVLDIFLILLASPVLVPLVLTVALAVRLALGSPVLFSHVRPGLHGAPFRMIKFRTMTNARDEAGNLLPDAERMTRFGRFLRSTSLDELPELWNVLKGEMSLVGPRPLLTEYLALYSPDQARRHDVRPGITGWAQVNGRNALTWDEKFAHDLWYVDNRSLRLDVKILLMTLRAAFSREGITSEGEATAAPFTGNSSGKA